MRASSASALPFGTPETTLPTYRINTTARSCVGVYTQEAIQFYLNACFLFGFADCGLFRCVADVNKTGRKTPETAFRLVPALNQQNLPVLQRQCPRYRLGIAIEDKIAFQCMLDDGVLLLSCIQVPPRTLGRSGTVVRYHCGHENCLDLCRSRLYSRKYSTSL